MDNINKKIKDTLKKTNIPCYYLKRKKGTFPCIVYTYREKPNAFNDNLEETTEYDIYINLYVKENIETTKEKLRVALQNDGFIKQEIRAPISFESNNEEEEEFFQVIFNYIKMEAVHD